MRKLKLRFMQTNLYAWLVKNVIPYIRFTTYYTSMRGKKYHRIYDAVKPGHIILTIDKRKLTTMLIPGEFAHAAVCVSKDTEFEVAEMTHTDYTKSTVADLCFEADRVVVLECTKFDKEYTKKFINNTLSFEGTLYDDQFELGIKALSCSELVWAADDECRLEASLDDIAGLGRPYISPTGLFEAKNVKVIIDSKDLD